MTSNAAASTQQTTPGLAGWLLQRLRGGLAQARGERRMRIAETLSLGGKRQLLLVVCDGERFLIGAGADSVQSITALGCELAS
jgi:flagellar biogenesis protein FliO